MNMWAEKVNIRTMIEHNLRVWGGSLFFAGVLIFTSARAQTWEPVDDPEALSALFSDTVITATLKDGVTAVANYRSDGTGEIQAWGDTFQRTWEVNDKGEVCVGFREEIRCYRLERDTETQYQYRATNLKTGLRGSTAATRA